MGTLFSADIDKNAAVIEKGAFSAVVERGAAVFKPGGVIGIEAGGVVISVDAGGFILGLVVIVGMICMLICSLANFSSFITISMTTGAVIVIAFLYVDFTKREKERKAIEQESNGKEQDRKASEMKRKADELEEATVAKRKKQALETAASSKFELAYSDKGTGAKQNCYVWRHTLHPGQYRIMYTVNNINSAPQYPLPVVTNASDILAKPHYFQCAWTDKKTGGRKDGQLWRAIPPQGYVALSDVAVHMSNADYMPGTILAADQVDPHFRCVRSDMTHEVTTALDPAWTDKGSGGKYDGACYRIPESLALVVATGYERDEIRHRSFHVLKHWVP